MNPNPAPDPSHAPTASANLAETYLDKVKEAMELKKTNGELHGAEPGQILMAQAEVGRSIIKTWLQQRRAANKAATFAPDYDPASAAKAEADIVALLNPSKLGPSA